MRGGRATLVRVTGFDQLRAHNKALQEILAAGVVGRTHGTVRAGVQAAQSQPKTFSRAHAGSGYRGDDAGRALRGRRGNDMRRTAVHFTEGQVSDLFGDTV